MKNQFIVTWQYDNEGDAGSVKVMSFDTHEDAVSFLEKSAKVGHIRNRSAEGFPHSDRPEFWRSPGFEGTVARSIALVS